MNDIALILLAGGSSQRFGAHKQRQLFEGEPLLRRSASTALAVSSDVVVVTGAEHESSQAALTGLTCRTEFNARWEHGMGSSIAAGARLISQSFDGIRAVIVWVADQPLVCAEDLRRLIASYRSAPDFIHVSTFAGSRGPPCVFPSKYLRELMQLDGPQGARNILARYSADVCEFAMPSAVFDVDTPEDLTRALTMHATCLA